MSFTTIKEEIKIFGKRKYQLMKDYVELDEEMKKRLAAGTIGTKTAQDQLDQAYNNAKKESQHRRDELADKIEVEYEKELKTLKESVQSVTADDVAELSLLASTKEITKEELEGYFVKYANKPLALKKIREIANEKPDLLMIDFERLDTEQRLYNLRQRLKQEVYFIDGNYLVNGDKIALAGASMTINDTMEHLDQLVDEYMTDVELKKNV